MKKRAVEEIYPTCVRHLQARKDVKLRHFFLCDTCTKKWSTEAFEGNKPLYQGEMVKGFCLLCNSDSVVRLRTWFLCDICDRVARSIGRNHVAEQAIMDFWDQAIKPTFPKLRLIQNDASALRPHRPDTAKSGVADIDFLVTDETRQNIFAIENKTGRNSIKEMSKFQLDVSDCNCILNEMGKLKIPAYIIHAQVLENWKPPTVGFRSVGLWWTDVFQMTENFTGIKQRRDESRSAAYFKKAACGDDLRILCTRTQLRQLLGECGQHVRQCVDRCPGQRGTSADCDQSRSHFLQGCTRRLSG